MVVGGREALQYCTYSSTYFVLTRLLTLAWIVYRPMPMLNLDYHVAELMSTASHVLRIDINYSKPTASGLWNVEPPLTVETVPKKRAGRRPTEPCDIFVRAINARVVSLSSAPSFSHGYMPSTLSSEVVSSPSCARTHHFRDWRYLSTCGRTYGCTSALYLLGLTKLTVVIHISDRDPGKGIRSYAACCVVVCDIRDELPRCTLTWL